MKTRKIEKLIEKGWVYGTVENDEYLSDWLITAGNDFFGTYFNENGTEIKYTPADFPCVMYDFGVGGISYTIGKDEQDCNNNGMACEDEWENIEANFIDYLLAL